MGMIWYKLSSFSGRQGQMTGRKSARGKLCSIKKKKIVAYIWAYKKKWKKIFFTLCVVTNFTRLSTQTVW